ncbi:Cadmium, cobalt and zinc/H(+)-K(+) antiporter [Paraconexibacter sp. AEG42_29]|uniref:Cadmium, cobalt and zinc/H(+)-K(+) antiporter n=1 Tax=Paraconexibacter sp. AEG42_29 TaxID=2997339 RepID=A0AAU7B2P5_9ACTN
MGDATPQGSSHGGHSGHGHSHAIGPDANVRRLSIALALIVSFMVVEVIVGIAVSSLALLSDAAHMLTDAAAIVLSLVAIRLAARPAKGALTYGLKRAEILAAQVNGATLLVLGLLIVIEGVQRIVHPPEVEGAPVLIVAIVGVVVNLIAAWVLAGADRRSLNVEGSFQHVLTDLYAFIATAVAGAVMLLTDWRQADGVAALFVAATMLRAAYSLLMASGRVFLEAAPAGLDPEAIGHAMACQPDVVEVHDLHVWEVTSGFPALSAHILVAREADWHAVRLRLAEALERDFGITHSTIQVDQDGDQLLEIAPL